MFERDEVIEFVKAVINGGDRHKTLFGDTSTPPRKVPCSDCGKSVVLPGIAWDLSVVASKYLLARGEKPLANNELTRCKPCGKKWHAR